MAAKIPIATPVPVTQIIHSPIGGYLKAVLSKGSMGVGLGRDVRKYSAQPFRSPDGTVHADGSVVRFPDGTMIGITPTKAQSSLRTDLERVTARTVAYVLRQDERTIALNGAMQPFDRALQELEASIDRAFEKGRQEALSRLPEPRVQTQRLLKGEVTPSGKSYQMWAYDSDNNDVRTRFVVTSGQIDDASRQVYSSGQCHALALALGETGYPIVRVTSQYEPAKSAIAIHFGVELNGELVDIHGKRPFSKALVPLGHDGPVRCDYVTPDELKELWTVKDVNEQPDYFPPITDVARSMVPAVLRLAGEHSAAISYEANLLPASPELGQASSSRSLDTSLTHNL